MNNKSSRYSSSKIKKITLIIPYLVINYCNMPLAVLVLFLPQKWQ